MKKGSNSPQKSPQGKSQSPRQPAEMEKYFLKLNRRPESTKLHDLQENAMKNVCKSLKKGELQVNNEATNLQNLFQREKQKEKEREKIQKEKEAFIERKRAEFNEDVNRLDMRQRKSIDQSKIYTKQYSNHDVLKYKPNSVLTKEQHESLVLKVIEAQESQSKKRKEYIRSVEKMWKEEEEKERQEQEKKKRTEKERKKQDIEKKLNLRREMNEKLSILELKNNRQLEQIKKKQYLHDKLQGKFHSQVLLPQLQEKKKRLREIREISKGFSVEELNQHEKQYIKRRHNSSYFKPSRVSDEWVYKPPEKTQKLNKILEEELSDKKKKLEEKKRWVEEKKLREENFVKYTKEKYPPKLNEQLQKQIEQRLIRQKQKKKEPSTYTESRVIGKNYLSEAKKMKKRIEDASRPGSAGSNNNNKQEGLGKRSYSNYLHRHNDDVYYEEKRRKRLESLMNSNENKIQKIRKLQMESKKISQELSQKEQLMKYQKDPNIEKETAELLLASLQAKMGLMDIYNIQS